MYSCYTYVRHENQVHAVDLDQGENAAVRYELTKGPGELFRVSRSTGEIFLRHNFESQNNGRISEFKLTVAAFDGGIIIIVLHHCYIKLNNN